MLYEVITLDDDVVLTGFERQAVVAATVSDVGRVQRIARAEITRVVDVDKRRDRPARQAGIAAVHLTVGVQVLVLHARLGEVLVVGEVVGGLAALRGDILSYNFV